MPHKLQSWGTEVWQSRKGRARALLGRRGDGGGVARSDAAKAHMCGRADRPIYGVSSDGNPVVGHGKRRLP
jgi:hypothetical protein